MTYDPRMDNLPLFISYPRTGAHWINCVMELYFDRPRLREGRTTFLDGSREDWMWFHDHDMDLDIEHDDVLFLYRAPVETVFSNMVYYSKKPAKSLLARLFKKNATSADRDEVRESCDIYRRHCQKWLLSDQKARTVIRHENFKSDRTAEFRKISEHFGTPLSEERMGKAFGTVTREALVARTGDTAEMGKHMLGDGYKASREAFADNWGEFIQEQVISPELRPFF